MSPVFKHPHLLIKRATLALLLFVVFSCNKNASDTESTITSVDVAIINGQIIDGTGKEAFPATVYINGDSIVFIGQIANPDLKIGKTIDAAGKFVSPGFIDLHAHGNPLRTPDFENFLAMGVTSIVLGQDGSSPRVNDLKS